MDIDSHSYLFDMFGEQLHI